jgi:tripartite-type tricarboxylate transporter receptor subunit TctC
MNPDANYTLKDFTPITALARLPTILVIRPDVPANTLAEFVALAKAKPGAMSFGSAGTGSIHQMTMIIFEKTAGITLLHVPYRGGTGLVNALLTGEVDAGWSGIPNVVSLIKTGKLRALCISVLQRDESLPDVATCDELGYKGFDVATVLGLQSSARAADDCRQIAVRGGKGPPRARHRRAIKDARYPSCRKRYCRLHQIHARRPQAL